jgi:hypothetical protein
LGNLKTINRLEDWRRLDDDIKMDHEEKGVELIQQAQNVDVCRALVNTVMNRRVQANAGYLLTN